MVVQPLRVAGDGPLCSLWDNSTPGGSQDAFSVLLLLSPSLVAQECSSSKLTSYPGCPQVHVTSAGDNSGGRPISNCSGSTLLSLTPNRENPRSNTSLTSVTAPFVEIQLLQPHKPPQTTCGSICTRPVLVWLTVTGGVYLVRRAQLRRSPGEQEVQ